MKFILSISHSEKEEVTMLKTNESGYVLLEMIVCLALTTLLISICVPIIIHIKTELIVLSDRTDVYHYLYNDIQSLNQEQLPITKTKQIRSTTANFSFYLDDDLIVGRGVWVNAKERTEQIYVYYYPKSD